MWKRRNGVARTGLCLNTRKGSRQRIQIDGWCGSFAPIWEGALGEPDRWVRDHVGLLVSFPNVGRVGYVSKALTSTFPY